MTREDLEKLALEICSPELYYDLADNINEADDDELYKILEAKGNFKRELELNGQNIEDYA